MTRNVASFRVTVRVHASCLHVPSPQINNHVVFLLPCHLQTGCERFPLLVTLPCVRVIPLVDCMLYVVSLLLRLFPISRRAPRHGTWLKKKCKIPCTGSPSSCFPLLPRLNVHRNRRFVPSRPAPHWLCFSSP
ncbi:hypothetical protein TRVL_04164 [Trypanosoma vivax]|nr:hypothetical protein TRVL_04164 [Trypanosoma vivax]